MKIAYVATLPIPSTTANTVHVMKMAQALAHNGHDVSVFCPHHPDTPTPANTAEIYAQYGVAQNFKFRPLKTKPSRLGLFIFALLVAKNAKAENTDLVFSRCLVSGWICALYGLPVLYEKHSSFDGQDAITKNVFRALTRNRNYKGLVVISQALKDHLVERFSLRKNSVIVAADGADPVSETPVPPPFDKPPGSFHAGYIGHLYKGRGIDVIAAAAQQLPDITFHIVGGNESDVREWKQKLTAQANIKFYGHVAHAETIKFLKNFDVLLAPYQRKVTVLSEKLDTAAWMSPLKVFEYMSSGVPMIASDLQILHEVLEDRKNAYLCDPENADKWALTLRHIRTNPGEALQVAANAREDLLSRYTWRKRAENIMAAIKTL